MSDKSWIPKRTDEPVIMFGVTTKNNVLIANSSIKPDGFSSILLKNIGDCDVTINDNIPLAPGSVWSFDNQPYVFVDEFTTIRFVGTGTTPKVLVVKSYFKAK